MVGRVFLLAMLGFWAVVPLASASGAEETRKADDGGSWVSLDQYLKTSPAVPTAPVGKSATKLLPSLTGQEEKEAPVFVPLPRLVVDFAGLPPLFERPKPSPLVADKPAPRRAAAVVVPPIESKPSDACSNDPEAVKRAQAMAKDRETLAALQQAVKELKVQDKVDFMLPPHAVVTRVTTGQSGE